MWWLLTNVVCSGGPPHAIWRDADVMKNLCSSSSLPGPFFTHRHTTKYWFSCMTYEWGSLTNLVRKSPYITFFGESSQEKNNVLEQKRDEDLRLWEKPKMAIKSRPFSVSLARDTKYLFFFPTMLKNGKILRPIEAELWIERDTWLLSLAKNLMEKNDALHIILLQYYNEENIGG